MPIRGSEVVRTGSVVRQHQAVRAAKSLSSAEVRSEQNHEGTPSEDAKAKSGTGPDSSKLIVIHVCDEVRRITKDFKCTKDILVREMRYFRSYLRDLHRVDISVHCDVNIFEWLMEYVKSSEREPKLEPKSVVSIMIASDFLGMDRLVRSATEFAAKNFNDITQLPIDLSCINEKLLGYISVSLSEEQLGELRDPSQKILPRIFRKKLEHLLMNHGDNLRYCKLCRKVFLLDHQHEVPCRETNPDIDFRGAIRSVHRVKRKWNIIKDFIEPCRVKFAVSWEILYWYLWFSSHFFRCTTCRNSFDGTMLNSCFAHGSTTIVNLKQVCSNCSRSPVSQFSWVNQPIADGCRAMAHSMDPDFSPSRQIGLIRSKFHLVEPLVLKLKQIPVVESTDGNDIRAKVDEEDFEIGMEDRLREERHDKLDSSFSKSALWVSSKTPNHATDELVSFPDVEESLVQPLGIVAKSQVGISVNDRLDSLSFKTSSIGSILQSSPKTPAPSDIWVQERIRDEDAVNMHSLVERLRKLRNKEG